MKIRLLAVLSAVFIALAPTADASPVEGLTVATDTHVDSPKVYWQDNNFTLKAG
ncbi:MAG: hypothetical protein Q4A71_01995 [Actinomycetaceae bacterium]|nr:hypothetical protein [Actinomycetaceae bacterium]